MGFIKGLAKLAGYLIGILVIVVGATMIVARFSDGPMELIAGGPFTSGEPVSTEPDWSFVKDYGTVEFQLLDPAASRTTWLAVVDGRVRDVVPRHVLHAARDGVPERGRNKADTREEGGAPVRARGSGAIA